MRRDQEPRLPEPILLIKVCLFRYIADLAARATKLAAAEFHAQVLHLFPANVTCAGNSES